MLDLSQLSRLAVDAILIAFASLVFVQLLTGQINTRDLLYGSRADGGRYFSPGRVQLLVITIFTALGLYSERDAQRQ
ncbi:MAG: hypothetical protein WB609_07255 [Candidatus Cybelea sp.]